jgi:hypothetical protein
MARYPGDDGADAGSRHVNFIRNRPEVWVFTDDTQVDAKVPIRGRQNRVELPPAVRIKPIGGKMPLRHYMPVRRWPSAGGPAPQAPDTTKQSAESTRPNIAHRSLL